MVKPKFRKLFWVTIPIICPFPEFTFHNLLHFHLFCYVGKFLAWQTVSRFASIYGSKCGTSTIKCNAHKCMEQKNIGENHRLICWICICDSWLEKRCITVQFIFLQKKVFGIKLSQTYFFPSLIFHLKFPTWKSWIISLWIDNLKRGKKLVKVWKLLFCLRFLVKFSPW